MGPWDCISRLNDEKDELTMELSKWSIEPTLEQWKEVEYEAADCANFLMMLVDIGRDRYYPELREPFSGPIEAS